MIEDDLERYEGYEPRVRPSKSGSKPRSKNRPQHEDAKNGLVIAVDRGRYRVILDENTEQERLLTCTRARELRSQAIVTGDIVDVVGDTTGVEGSLARIVRIHPRQTVLRRSADDSDTFERIIVANADQLLMVVAAASPSRACASWIDTWWRHSMQESRRFSASPRLTSPPARNYAATSTMRGSRWWSAPRQSCEG
jgi:hypothetical protein